jgi:putative ABC transport system substrate-binding protein
LQVSDPVGGGFVGSLAHPGGNITGFTNFEAEIGGKWLRTLKDIAPTVENVGFIFIPETSAHREFLQAAERALGALNVKIIPLGVHKVDEVENTISRFASVPNGGMIVSPHPSPEEN